MKMWELGEDKASTILQKKGADKTFTPSRQMGRHEEEHNFNRTESEPRSK
jgi:hypothetical protein